jgi:antitoxin YobK
MTLSNYYAARKLMFEMDRELIADPNTRPASLHQIEETEQRLKVKFPPSYRQFLADFGSGGFEGWEIYGIGCDLMGSGIISSTLKRRSDVTLDPKYVIIEDGGDGTYVAIDTGERDVASECPLVRLSVDGKPIEHVSDSFGTWLLDELTWRMSPDIEP